MVPLPPLLARLTEDCDRRVRQLVEQRARRRRQVRSVEIGRWDGGRQLGWRLGGWSPLAWLK